MNKIKDIFKLYHSFYNFNPKQNSGLLGINLFLALSQGISIILLIPLLQMLEKTSFGGDNRIVRALDQAAGHLGITVNIEVVICVYLALLSLNIFLSYIKSTWQSDVQQDYTAKIRTDIFSRLIHCNWLYLSGKNRNEFSQVLTSEIPRVTVLNNFLLSLLSTLISFSIHLIFAIYVSWNFTVFVVVCGLVLFLVLNRFVKTIYHVGNQNFFTNRKFYKQFDDLWDTIKLAKIHGNEGLHLDRFTQINKQFAHERKRMVRLKTKPQAIIRICSSLILSLIIYFGYKYGNSTLSMFYILILLFARIFPQLMKIQTDYMQIISLIPAYDQTMKLKHELDEMLVSSQELKTESLPARIKLTKGINFKDVSFGYTKDTAIFDNFDCFIPAQNLTGIIGTSGVGKTSMLDMIARLFSPDTGYISIDGKKISDIDNSVWRESIAYVPQDSFFTNTSIRDNLCLGASNIDEKKIWYALKKTKAYNFVSNAPEGLETRMHNNAQQFSGGERQRLAIARALLREPSLLLLDEITGALDHENEQSIMKVLNELKENITIVMITHKRELHHHFDHVIDLS